LAEAVNLVFKRPLTSNPGPKLTIAFSPIMESRRRFNVKSFPSLKQNGYHPPHAAMNFTQSLSPSFGEKGGLFWLRRCPYLKLANLMY
jgi:hypothetical protein